MSSSKHVLIKKIGRHVGLYDDYNAWYNVNNAFLCVFYKDNVDNYIVE